MCHFESRSLESTLDIETLVRFRTIQNRLVAAHFLCDEIEGLDEFQAELLALLVFRHGNVFDVSYESEVVDAANARISTSVFCQFQRQKGDRG